MFWYGKRYSFWYMLFFLYVFLIFLIYNFQWETRYYLVIEWWEHNGRNCVGVDQRPIKKINKFKTLAQIRKNCFYKNDGNTMLEIA